jgi:hypothetical protein
VTDIREEYLTASIRKQIAYLEGLLKELENNPQATAEWKKHVHDVEVHLHRLRDSLSPTLL